MQLLEVRAKIAVERRGLVRVFSVAKFLRERRVQSQILRKRSRGVAGESFFEMVRDRAIVGGCAGKDFRRQFPAGFERSIALRFDFLRDRLVIRWLDNHRDTPMILGCAAQHGRPANIYILDGFIEANTQAGDRLLEGI